MRVQTRGLALLRILQTTYSPSRPQSFRKSFLRITSRTKLFNDRPVHTFTGGCEFSTQKDSLAEPATGLGAPKIYGPGQI